MRTTTVATPIRQGVNLDEFVRFCEYARSHPDAVQFVLEAIGTYEGRVAHTRARTGPYTLGDQRIDRVAWETVYHLGAHKEVEHALGFVDPTDREEPTEVVLAALTGCINTVIASSAVARGIELTHLETRASIGWDPFVFLHLREPGDGSDLVDQFGPLEVTVEVAADGLTEDDRAYLLASVNRSAAYNLLRLAHQAQPQIEVVPARAS